MAVAKGSADSKVAKTKATSARKIPSQPKRNAASKRTSNPKKDAWPQPVQKRKKTVSTRAVSSPTQTSDSSSVAPASRQTASVAKANNRSRKGKLPSDSAVKANGRVNGKGGSATAATTSSSTARLSEGDKTGAASTMSDSIDEFPYFKEERKPNYYDEAWAGNNDETGSVCSGMLDEDFCVACGKSTLSSVNLQEVVLCDCCDSEYHIKCLGLSAVPEGDFECPRCLAEWEYTKSTSFELPGGVFPLPRGSGKDSTKSHGLVYSFSRPLAAAWAECQQKGLMVVSQVFSYSLLQRLLWGEVTQTSKSGRKTCAWRGALPEIAARIGNSGGCDVVDRGGRFDLKLPDFVVAELQLETVLEPMLAHLRTIMPTSLAPSLRTHNIVFAPIHSPAQKWHYDDSADQRKPYRYFTILIHLNPLEPECGGTEIWGCGDRGDLVRARPGDALVFPGNLMHRGLANHGRVHRYFYYAAFACHKDVNAGQM